MSISLPTLSADLNAHQNQDDRPALSASEMKMAWDKSANDIKDYINDLLIPQINTQVSSEISSQVSSAVATAKEEIEEDINDLDTRLTAAQASIGQNASNITSLQNSVAALGQRVTNIENGSGTVHVANAISINNGTKDYEDTVKVNKQVNIFCNVASSGVPSGGLTTIGTLANGYRPSTNIKRKVNCGSNTGGGAAWFSDLYINASGLVQINNQSGFTATEYNFNVSFTTV
jgi:gas vesicle protein